MHCRPENCKQFFGLSKRMNPITSLSFNSASCWSSVSGGCGGDEFVVLFCIRLSVSLKVLSFMLYDIEPTADCGVPGISER